MDSMISLKRMRSRIPLKRYAHLRNVMEERIYNEMVRQNDEFLAVLTDKDAALTDQCAAFADKEAKLADKDATLAERDAEIERLKAQLRETVK